MFSPLKRLGRFFLVDQRDSCRSVRIGSPFHFGSVRYFAVGCCYSFLLFAFSFFFWRTRAVYGESGSRCASFFFFFFFSRRLFLPRQKKKKKEEEEEEEKNKKKEGERRTKSKSDSETKKNKSNGPRHGNEPRRPRWRSFTFVLIIDAPSFIFFFFFLFFFFFFVDFKKRKENASIVFHAAV